MDEKIERIRVKPAVGRRVLHPRSMQPLTNDGRWVAKNDAYWRRRVKACDVEVMGTYTAAIEAPQLDEGSD